MFKTCMTAAAAALAVVLVAGTIDTADARGGHGGFGGHGGMSFGGGAPHFSGGGFGSGPRFSAPNARFSSVAPRFNGPRFDHGNRFDHRHVHFAHRRFVGVPFAYGYYGYSDGCYWLRRRALDIGSSYWWNRYYACLDGYYY